MHESLPDWLRSVDRSWTLFLDRDGTINRRLEGDYVKHWDQFSFLPGVLSALADCAELFGTIVIVTNQQGIGKGLMSETDLKRIHEDMLYVISFWGGRIDQIYACPDLAELEPACRKPNPGMALQAKQDFPEIDFHKSIMIGDEEKDVAFGKRLGMKTFRITATDHPDPQKGRVPSLRAAIDLVIQGRLIL